MGILHFLKQKKNVKQVKKELNQKLKTIKDTGLKTIIEEENLRDDFFEIMFKINCERNTAKRKQLITKAKKIAVKIPELSGWPKSSKFWDVEALAWIVNIPKPVREYIKKQLNKLSSGTNLSLGCGSYPYVNNSVLIDFSEEMLKAAPPRFKNKVLFDLNDKNLPFRSFSFDSATMVFIINYIKDLKYLLREVKRVVKENGKIMIVQSAKPIAAFYRMKEKKSWKPEDVEKILKTLKLKTNTYTHTIGRTQLIFIEGVKK